MNVCNHLRQGATGLESFCSKVYTSGENLLSLGTHAEAQAEAYTIHNAMSTFGLPAQDIPYHQVVLSLIKLIL